MEHIVDEPVKKVGGFDNGRGCRGGVAVAKDASDNVVDRFVDVARVDEGA
jgi:hypothetical protein